MQQRLDQFDILKGIGIILVLLGHLPTGKDCHMLIYTFHMPLFFFCSGFFFKKQPLVKQFKKDMKGLLVPYLFFASILIMTIAVMQVLHNHSFYAITNIDLNPLDSQCYPLYHTIWFLICLFFTRELYNALYTHKYIITNVLVAGGYTIAQILQYLHITIYFFIDSALGMMIFYAMGHIFRQTELCNKRMKWYYSVLILLLYLGAMEYVQPFVDTRDNMYPWYLFITAMIPILMLYYISFEMAYSNSKIVRVIKICGISSLFIFALHGPIFEIAYPIMERLGCSDIIQTFVLLLSIPICIVAERIINKYAPCLIGKF